MLANWNNSFNRPSYNQYYSDYSQAFQKDNYKCKMIPSNKPDGKLEGNQGFLNAGNKTLHDWGFSALRIPEFDDFCGPGSPNYCDQLPPMVYPCEQDFPKVENCIVYQCNQSGFCFSSGFFGPKLPWYLDPFWDIFVEDPFFNYYNPPNCNPIQKDPNCPGNCPDTTEQMNSQLEQAIWNAGFGGNCQGGITTYSFVITGPAYKGAQYIGENGEPTNNEKGIFGEVSTFEADCQEACKMKEFCGSGGFGYIGGVAFGHSAIDFYYYDDLNFQQSLNGNAITTTIVMGVQLCFVSSNVETITVTDWFTGHSTTLKYHPIYNVDAIFKVVDVAFMGSFTGSAPKFDSGSCLQSFAVAKICYGSGDDYRYTSREPSGGGPDQKPEKRKPKEEPPECMQCCTCEQVEAIVNKVLNPQLSGGFNVGICGGETNRLDWNNTGLKAINDALINVGVGLQLVNAGLCSFLKRSEPTLEGEFTVFNCSPGKSGNTRIPYKGYGIKGLSEQIQALGNAQTASFIESCLNQISIQTKIDELPEKIQIQLSDDIALIVSKLNQILEKIGGEDNLFQKIIQIITLIATLLGLLNDIRSLLDKQKDYTPDLELLKELAQEIKRLLSGNLQGSIDAIRCDGTISSNSWGGEGLEGLNQAITALGVNTAILHSDLCELLERKTDEIKPPRLQGSVDAIRCDGTINSNSWDGEGFEGLNQAITAIGINLAILHADLCEMLNENEKDTFQITDKYKCGDTEIVVEERIDSIIANELRFLYERLKRIELLICELEECNAVPVFPGDSIEERNIPAQAVITFVEQKYYPKMSGSKWHVSIPYPKEDLISEQNCWSKFENLIIKKGNVHGTVVWKSPNNTINRFYAGLFGHDENGLREFLERIAGFSRLQKATIRITTGGNPRARPKDVTIQAVKVVVLERDDQGRMVPVKCCRAPKSERYLG